MLRQPTFTIKTPPLKFLILLFFSFIAFFSSSHANGNKQWQPLEKGIEYQDLTGSFLTPWSHIHAFRINLKENQLSLITAKGFSRTLASADEFSQKSRALITINGGFFDETFNPLGLRITHYKTLSALKHISWWGVFFIKNNQPYIASASQFQPKSTISFAIQSGPRVLINGHIPPLKPGRAQRTALGITNDNKVIIIVTDNSPLSTVELAQLMKSAPLYCVNAINLDGGSSTQLNARLPDFQLMVHGFANVSDAIIVTPL